MALRAVARGARSLQEDSPTGSEAPTPQALTLTATEALRIGLARR
ncbi:MAG: hypothetical protein SF070_16295 [Gemmatimonadota bacterium]|nr:hypothetical protein [Gemmatimonadota bacterium]